MNEHALDAMIYAWMVIKEKEENKMEGIYLGKITSYAFYEGEVALSFDNEREIRASEILYSNGDYILVESDEVIKTNDELLKLRDRVKELEDAKAKVAELEKKLAAAKSNETYWRDRKEEEEEYHHYWLNTYNLAVEHAKNKGVRIIMTSEDEENNAGVILVENKKAEKLENTNQRLRQRICAAYSEKQIYWRNTYYAAVEAAKNEGVTIVSQDPYFDHNVARVKVTNIRADELEKQIKRLEEDNSIKASALISAKDRGDYWLREHSVKSRMYQELEEKHDAKWSAMMQAFKDKGVEVIYMGEEDGKPIIDIKIPGWESDKELVRKVSKQCSDIRADKFRLEGERDELKERCDILRKELDDLKSKKVAEVRYEYKPDCFAVIYTMRDGSKQTISTDVASDIYAIHIACGFEAEEHDCKDCKYCRYDGGMG